MKTPTDPHNWVKVPDGTGMTRFVSFRFCTTCDREEWDDGTVRPGREECS